VFEVSMRGVARAELQKLCEYLAALRDWLIDARMASLRGRARLQAIDDGRAPAHDKGDEKAAMMLPPLFRRLAYGAATPCDLCSCARESQSVRGRRIGAGDVQVALRAPVAWGVIVRVTVQEVFPASVAPQVVVLLRSPMLAPTNRKPASTDLTLRRLPE
jgi:hypothetical protein